MRSTVFVALVESAFGRILRGRVLVMEVLMKKMLTVLVVFGLGVALWGIFEGVPVTAAADEGRGGGVEKCASKNGDVNADGTVDLSDAVTILGHLFLGNPTQLVPLCVPPELTARIQELEAQLASAQADLATCLARTGLPATEQMMCYDTAGNVIPCASADFPGQDGFYQAGCPSGGRFVDNGDGTVTNTCTGLMWQKGTADVSGNGSIGTEVGNDDRLNWQPALKYCEDLDFAGHSDWRLPNVQELQSIIDYGRVTLAIDPVFEAVSGGYWTSSSHADIPKNAWVVNFDVGVDFPVVPDAFKYRGFWVRAVRSGP